MLPLLNLCRTKNRPQILHAVPRFAICGVDKFFQLPSDTGQKAAGRRNGRAMPSWYVADHVRWVRGSLYTHVLGSLRSDSDWTTDATHMLPQPDHVGSAVIR